MRLTSRNTGCDRGRRVVRDEPETPGLAVNRVETPSLRSRIRFDALNRTRLMGNAVKTKAGLTG